jgi:hypothetical protein
MAAKRDDRGGKAFVALTEWMVWLSSPTALCDQGLALVAFYSVFFDFHWPKEPLSA